MEGWPPGPHTPETSWFRDMRERGSQGAAAASPGPFTFTVPWVTLTKVMSRVWVPLPCPSVLPQPHVPGQVPASSPCLTFPVCGMGW